MNPIYAITNDDPRVQDGIKLMGHVGQITQRDEVGPMGRLYNTTFWKAGVRPYEINGPDMQQLAEHDGYECISGCFAFPVYRRIAAFEMLQRGMQINYHEPTPPPPPPPPPPGDLLKKAGDGETGTPFGPSKKPATMNAPKKKRK